MQFEESFIYHIYNQGNNRQKIFFNKENYIFFLKKNKSTYYTIYRYTSLEPNAQPFSFNGFSKLYGIN
jgi:hypothetical protein